MDVLGFVCSSKIQLHDSLGSKRARAYSWIVSIVRMATVLKVYTTKESVLVCVFYEQEGSVPRIFINKWFLFTVGNVCRVKRFHLGPKRFAVGEQFETELRK
jgi:hypothetical protein